MRCTELPRPDAIFIGGGLTDGSSRSCVVCPEARGTNCANAVRSRGRLLAAFQRFGGELLRIDIARAEPVEACTAGEQRCPSSIGGS